MSWLSELTWSNRDEHIDAMLTGDAELDESVVSTYDRPQGFKFKLAQRLAAGLLPTVGATDKGKTLQTNETTGAPEWAEASGGGMRVYEVSNGAIEPNLAIMDLAGAILVEEGKSGLEYSVITRIYGVSDIVGAYYFDAEGHDTQQYNPDGSITAV